jgi:hypothetical protein
MRLAKQRTELAKSVTGRRHEDFEKQRAQLNMWERREKAQHDINYARQQTIRKSIHES